MSAAPPGIRRWRLVPALAGTALLAAGWLRSDAPQDIFKPEGRNAEKIANLNFVYILAAVVALIVFAVVAFVLWKFRDRKDDEQQVPKQVHGNTRLEIMWTIAPAVLLAIVRRAHGEDDLRPGRDASPTPSRSPSSASSGGGSSTTRRSRTPTASPSSRPARW